MNEPTPADLSAEQPDPLTVEVLEPPSERWPHVPAVQGNLYSFKDPRHEDQRMIAMSLDTWMALKQSIDDMTDKLRSAQSANIELAMKYQNAMQRNTVKQIILTPARGMKIPD